jgi:hypothetical protein
VVEKKNRRCPQQKPKKNLPTLDPKPQGKGGRCLEKTEKNSSQPSLPPGPPRLNSPGGKPLLIPLIFSCMPQKNGFSDLFERDRGCTRGCTPKQPPSTSPPPPPSSSFMPPPPPRARPCTCISTCTRAALSLLSAARPCQTPPSPSAPSKSLNPATLDTPPRRAQRDRVGHVEAGMAQGARRPPQSPQRAHSGACRFLQVMARSLAGVDSRLGMVERIENGEI